MLSVRGMRGMYILQERAYGMRLCILSLRTTINNGCCDSRDRSDTGCVAVPLFLRNRAMYERSGKSEVIF